ncbi:MAG: proton-conducting transporter membrane subunit, partial [Planctomycetales bacterium]
DAMEGPTPVSALVHSATMVAAGVYLAGRFYPVFTAEVLLIIAYTGAITLIIAATIAVTATDIKKVLAYSTVSQLGYMMLAIGLGGWLAGLFHLITHAFFKSLLFMCSGSVIHACHHEQEMPKMGGLIKKLPWTGWTMFVGVLAIAGAGIPYLDIGFSGYYSKDAIIAQAMSFYKNNPSHILLVAAPLIGAAITSFYMFRLWFYTFLGEPRDQHVHDHVGHEHAFMFVPLLILATFAATVGLTLPTITGNLQFAWEVNLVNFLEQARPAGAQAAGQWGWLTAVPEEHASHALSIHRAASLAASGTAVLGFALAAAFYWFKVLSPAETAKQFPSIHRFLLGKWWFDELYHAIFFKPTHIISGWISEFDKLRIDAFLNGLAKGTVRVSRELNDQIDKKCVDGTANGIAAWTYRLASSLRQIQTGSIRQYVMFIALGTVGLFLVISYLWSFTSGGP